MDHFLITEKYVKNTWNFTPIVLKRGKLHIGPPLKFWLSVYYLFGFLKSITFICTSTSITAVRQSSSSKIKNISSKVESLVNEYFPFLFFFTFFFSFLAKGMLRITTNL